MRGCHCALPLKLSRKPPQHTRETGVLRGALKALARLVRAVSLRQAYQRDPTRSADAPDLLDGQGKPCGRAFFFFIDFARPQLC